MCSGTIKRWLIIGTAVVLLGAAWFVVSPLFLDRVVDEELKFSPAGGAPTRGQIEAMPAEQRAGMRERLMHEAAAADSNINEVMPSMNAPTVVSRGRFRDVDSVHKGEGEATVYALPDGTHLVRFEHFRVTNGPALVVYLAQHPDPANADEVLAGFYELGPLKGNVGNQNYSIPAGVNVADYKSVVIWCKLFDVLFSPAGLRQGDS